MVLHAVADGEAQGLEREGLGLGGEEHVDAGQALLPGQLQGAPGELEHPGLSVLAAGNQEPPASRRRERGGDDQLRVVGHPGPFRGGGPGEVEDEFAAAVALRVGRCGRNEPVPAPEGEVPRLPARGP